MNVKPIILSVALALAAASGAAAQSLLDLPELLGRRQQTREQDSNLKAEYNIDFQYFFDHRSFGVSDDIFMLSETYHVARFSPSAIFRFDQNRDITHRIAVGFDFTKDLGANPTAVGVVAETEHKPGLRNTELLKDFFYYYRISAKLGGGVLDAYAGIHPRSALGGDYTRAIFADDVIYYDPNLEGVTLRYDSPKFKAEITGDAAEKKGIDRVGTGMVFTAGVYSPKDWFSLGWSAAYTHITGNYLNNSDVDNALFNPYVKIDLGSMLHMQELSLKAGPMLSYQYDYMLRPQKDEDGTVISEGEPPHYPMGAEFVFNARHWNLGIEDTFYFGEDLQPYMAASYSTITHSEVYVDYLYSGEPFYFTRRSRPTWYNRAELYYRPLSTSYLNTRISLVGHFVTPAGADPATRIGPFIGWQAKATLLFNLDALRNPRGTAGSRRRSAVRRDGPIISL